MKTLYADAVGNMSLAERVVRFDLLNYWKIEGDKSAFVSNTTIAMSLPALLRTQRNLTIAIDKMVDAGLL